MRLFSKKANNLYVKDNFAKLATEMLSPNAVVTNVQLGVQLIKVAQNFFEMCFVFDASIDKELDKMWKQPIIDALNEVDQKKIEILQIVCLYQAYWVANIVNFGNVRHEFIEKTGIDRDAALNMFDKTKPSYSAVEFFADRFLENFNPMFSHYELIIATLLKSSVDKSLAETISEELHTPVNAALIDGVFTSYVIAMKRQLEEKN